ncbi:MAG: SDR family oxidoreductase [Clostridiales bacterium]|nr:SDR family oxidoreductase [Clostridiales bacterium]
MSYLVDMEGQVALVTGAGQGIGASIARKLTEAGAQVVINDVCDEEKIADTLQECEKVGKRPLYYQCDISDEAQVKKMFEVVSKKYGRLDVLVNNAGIVADWDKSYAVNTKAMYFCCEAAKDHLEKVKGRIVILTSASVFSGGTGYPQYNVTKAGCYALVLFLARNYAKLGIRVNGIAPAVIMSKMLITRFGSEEAIYEHYKDIMPLGKIGYPEDIANITLFLACELSNYMTGEVLIADGGRMHIG